MLSVTVEVQIEMRVLNILDEDLTAINEDGLIITESNWWLEALNQHADPTIPLMTTWRTVRFFLKGLFLP